MQEIGYWILNYIDDFMGAEEEEKAWKAYHALVNFFANILILDEKTVALTFLGPGSTLSQEQLK